MVLKFTKIFKYKKKLRKKLRSFLKTAKVNSGLIEALEVTHKANEEKILL